MFPGLLDRIECAESGVSRGSEDDISAFADLCQRDLFAFAGIVPGSIGDADVVLNHLDVWVCGLRALLESTLEAMNQPDVHAADKTNRVCLGSHSGDQSDEIRAFMFFENERSNVRFWSLAVVFENHAVDDR